MSVNVVAQFSLKTYSSANVLRNDGIKGSADRPVMSAEFNPHPGTTTSEPTLR